MNLKYLVLVESKKVLEAEGVPAGQSQHNLGIEKNDGNGL